MERGGGSKIPEGAPARPYLTLRGPHTTARLIVSVPSSFIDIGCRNAAQGALKLDKLESESEPDSIGLRLASAAQRYLYLWPEAGNARFW